MPSLWLNFLNHLCNLLITDNFDLLVHYGKFYCFDLTNTPGDIHPGVFCLDKYIKEVNYRLANLSFVFGEERIKNCVRQPSYLNVFILRMSISAIKRQYSTLFFFLLYLVCKYYIFLLQVTTFNIRFHITFLKFSLDINLVTILGVHD